MFEWKPQDLYPIHQVPVEPKLHQAGKKIVIGLIGLAAAAAANKAYDFGLGAWRHYKS